MDRNFNKRRIVITGLGAISSLGIGKDELWKNLLAGKSGVSRIASIDTSNYDRHYGGEVKNFDPSQFISKRRVQTIGRASQMAIAASKLALEDAQLKLEEIDRERVAVCIGTTMGEMQILEGYNDSLLRNSGNFERKSIPIYPANCLSSNVAIEFKLSNQNDVFSTACAAGNYALGYAYDLMKLLKIDYALVGGADAFSRIVFTGFGRLLAVAPQKCQPFDKDRKGMIPGEGAAMIVLETLESARKRGAHIYAEVLGYGLSCDARHMTHPVVEGISKAMMKAMENSGVKSSQIDYISAHGTGTKENDKAESSAINRVFGERTSSIPASSIKSMLGHTMGAASALEAIGCCLAIKNKHIPPTINNDEQDPNCVIDPVRNISRQQPVQLVLNNSFAFGGNNACLALTANG